MPRINLLPVKQLAKLEASRAELRNYGGLLLIVCLLCTAHYSWLAGRIAQAQSRTLHTQSAASSLQEKVVEIEAYKTKLAALAKKLDAIDKLLQRRTGPSRLLGIFADACQAHPKVWLTKWSQHDQLLSISGKAISQEDISAFQMDLQKYEPVLHNVTLTLVHVDKESNDQILQWTMTCNTDVATGATG